MTPDEILQGIQRVLAELPAAPPNPMTVIIPHRTWALVQAYRLYWQLREQGVNWRRAKRLRRKEYERLRKDTAL